MLIVLFFLIFQQIRTSKALSNTTLSGIGQCGVTATCMNVPIGCAWQNCTSAIAYSMDAYGITFGMAGITQDLTTYPGLLHFVAIGFSRDERMGKDTFITCVNNNTGGYVFAGYTDNWDATLDREATYKILTNTSQTYIDGTVYCSGRWNFGGLANVTNRERFFSFSNMVNQFHIFIVRGYANPLSAELVAHSTADGSDFPWISSDAINFCTNTSCNINITSAHQSQPTRMVKQTVASFHGLVMMAAWWSLIGPGILIARYLRCASTSAWFQLHRILVFIGFLATSAAFFGVFYEAGWVLYVFPCYDYCTYKDYSKQVHAILGIFVYACCWLQVLFGILRPGKTSTIRYCFNWFHRSIGLMAFTAASACCVIGVEIGKTGLSMGFGQYPYYFMIGSIGTFVGVAFICEVLSRRNSYEPAELEKPNSARSGCNGLSVILVLVYTGVSICCVIVLGYMLYQVYYGRGFRL
uniref:Cytochrome b561 domain-containing protein n=1 Tax=Panagrellus redivivus TaxID=6233 RepID=A0A7E4V6J1_PANRE